MKVVNVSLEAVATAPHQYPQDDRPEVAFAGRSNVGKSSLINAMLGRKALARTSQNPGKTRTINFYNVENALLFVDLPGYGYAKVSKSQWQQWGAMIEGYLTGRPQLKAVILLIDIRHPPTKNDVMMFDWLKHHHGQVTVVATKQDKIKRSQVQKHLGIIRGGLGLEATDQLFAFSSETKAGKEELWAFICQRVGIEAGE